LSYDNNGNLTDDGILAYVYDAWNRLVQVQRSAAGDTTTVATYVYDGKNRRVSKTVTNNGVENVDNDGGTQTVHFYYSNQWQILETRDGSNAARRQWAWGTRYVDQPLFMDVNGSPSGDNDCDPDSGVDSGDERASRPAVIAPKRFARSRTERGARTRKILGSLAATCVQRGQDCVKRLRPQRTRGTTAC
jgi:hypothetical protein